MPRKLRLGSRGSRLAMAQAETLKARLLLAHDGIEVEIVPIKTSGDLGNREEVGAFVREIQRALLRNDIDLALHCLKDLPTEPVHGLRLSAYCEREDVRDAFISRGQSFHNLAPGEIVGTGSVRRTSQLAARRGDLEYRPLAGNVDTRLRKLISGEYDAIVLAVAGLSRLGLLDQWASGEYAALSIEPFETQDMLPAPGQAVLVIETRLDDDAAAADVSVFEHITTRRCADAERAFLQEFGGGCSVPVAALATCGSGMLTLTGLVASPDGGQVLTDTESGPCDEGATIARALAGRFGERGAFGLFEARIPTPAEALP